MTAQKAVARMPAKTELKAKDKKPGFDSYSLQVKEYIEGLKESISELKKIKIINARKVKLENLKKTVTVIYIPLRYLKVYKPAAEKIQEALEKKLEGPVFVVGKRVVAHGIKAGTKGFRQFKPHSRTRQAVVDAYLNDVLYPLEVSGKRLRVTMKKAKPTAESTVYVSADASQKNAVKARLPLFAPVYKYVTGQEVKFVYRAN